MRMVVARCWESLRLGFPHFFWLLWEICGHRYDTLGVWEGCIERDKASCDIAMIKGEMREMYSVIRVPGRGSLSLYMGLL